jgi:hypothetical protein
MLAIKSFRELNSHHASCKCVGTVLAPHLAAAPPSSSSSSSSPPPPPPPPSNSTCISLHYCTSFINHSIRLICDGSAWRTTFGIIKNGLLACQYMCKPFKHHGLCQLSIHLDHCRKPSVNFRSWKLPQQRESSWCSVVLLYFCFNIFLSYNKNNLINISAIRWCVKRVMW